MDRMDFVEEVADDILGKMKPFIDCYDLEVGMDDKEKKELRNDLKQLGHAVMKKISEDGEMVQGVVSDMLNKFGDKQIVEFVEHMARSHRTLQQTFMKLIVKMMKQWGEDYVHNRYDGRNENTVKLASKIDDMIIKEKAYLPCI